MFIKVLGVKFRVECIVISVIIGMILGCHLFCGCFTKEGMENAGAALDYVMNKGVHNDKYEHEYFRINRSFFVWLLFNWTIR